MKTRHVMVGAWLVVVVLVLLPAGTATAVPTYNAITVLDGLRVDG